SGPSGSVSSNTATFNFSSESGATFACKLDAAAYVACSSPASYSSLASGSHTFSVRATDTVNNTDPSPPNRSWTVDTSPPDTSISTGPSGNVASSSASISFTSTEVGATFECRLDGSSFASCTSPKAYTGLADGSHTFDVRATDAAGNTDA